MLDKDDRGKLDYFIKSALDWVVNVFYDSTDLDCYQMFVKVENLQMLDHPKPYWYHCIPQYHPKPKTKLGRRNTKQEGRGSPAKNIHTIIVVTNNTTSRAGALATAPYKGLTHMSDLEADYFAKLIDKMTFNCMWILVNLIRSNHCFDTCLWFFTI